MNEQDNDVKLVFQDAYEAIENPVPTVEEYLKSRSISGLQEDIHALAKSKGWYDGPARNPLEMHMLIVSELAEATEEARKGTPAIYVHGAMGPIEIKSPVCILPTEKPEGELVELADAVIRIMDYCAYRGFNLEEAIQMKHEFNKSRAYRHGGKKY